MKERKPLQTMLSLFFGLLSIVWVYPIFMVIFNSFKKKAYINRSPFSLPNEKTFVGLDNYVEGFRKTHLLQSFGVSLFITVGAVAVILVCTSMCAWYISRVQSGATKGMYILCLFAMVVPFQMVMYPLSKITDMLGLGNPVGIIFVYLGFGAGLAVFMFTGFMKGVPVEVEEASMIDGCTPLGTFFKVVFPMLQPTLISVAILEAMWIWNDYLLPVLVLDQKRWKTIPMAIQYLKGGYGSIDWGAMMAMLVVSIVPIILFYISCQKHIIKGVAAGAVKG